MGSIPGRMLLMLLVFYAGANTATLTISSSITLIGYQYYCEVRNTGAGICSQASNAVQLTVNDNPTASASNNSPFCEPGTLQFTGSGTAGVTSYAWTGPFNYNVQNPVVAGATTMNNGVYTLTVTDGDGCQGTATTLVDITALPLVPSLLPITACEGATPEFTAGTGSIFQFTLNGNEMQAPSADNTWQPVTPMATGDQVCVNSISPFIFNGTFEPDWGNPLATSAGGPASSFGDNRIDAIYLQSNDDYIFGGIAGNLLDNLPVNKILLFIDCQPASGYNVLNWFPRNGLYFSVEKLNSGITMDPGFEPDYILGINHAGGDVFFDLYHMASNLNNYLGSANTSNLLGFSPNANSSDYSNGFEFAIPRSALGNPTGNIKVFAMLVNDPGFSDPNTLLSNQFLTRADNTASNYGTGAVFFGNALPDPIMIPLLSADCYSQSCVTVSDLPVAVITGNQELTCALTSITLSAASSTGQGTLSYLWSTGATTVSINVNAPVDYSVTVTDSDNGCTYTELVTVTQDITTPVAVITAIRNLPAR
ncbi:MAG: hypothetical protein IPF68_20410 [Bacteroidales bacterium]|nr:hypothetical protein [Bacteroidales bacterium]